MKGKKRLPDEVQPEASEVQPDPEATNEHKAVPMPQVKLTGDHCAELKARAEAAFKEQLDSQLKAYKGQTCSSDDTLRIKVSFEVTLEPWELSESRE